ncbi:MAG: OsmC family peroxiredoxin [Gemmatimonadaceae bacterium]|jgi:osmotically inducible protein OsmC|nr:OsmC family peroxiredoxin [Gemmatimonadaceae bacterium]
MQRTASANWSGDLKAGTGSIALGSGAYSGPYSFLSRFESGTGTNPEELLGAAHAGCYTMALANALAGAGHVATSVATTATVHLNKTDAGLTVTQIDLVTTATVPGITNEEFQKHAEAMKVGCIISRALAAVPMTLSATLTA